MTDEAALGRRAGSPEVLHAAHAVNGPTFAHAIVTTSELIRQLSA